ncbi:unnamed protein product [Caenorhabditis auriculariae]|uniref:Uncharacterized protein n=1 Tax=Caenorhabditis auriculariae TaxID=2777116 RepID=A0A8S1HJN9_9PELO|nr:unnamed protein product [Caenorhabditis auriculariae]
MNFVTFCFVAALLFVSTSAYPNDLQVSGSFRVAEDGEHIASGQVDESEHPFFELEAMKLARAYLEKKIAQERKYST